MKKLIIIVIVTVSSSFGAAAQKQDRIWCFGDSAGIDFNNLSAPAPLTSAIRFYSATNYSTISDSAGNLLFYAAAIYLSPNGLAVFNKNHQKMMNGDSLYGYRWTISLIIPVPDNSDRYYLFSIAQINATDVNLYYSTIDMSLDSGRGQVVSRDNYLYGNVLAYKLAACRHANGRDWWLMGLDYSNNNYYSFLITPYGFQGPFTQAIGSPSTCLPVGKMEFSYDGTKIYSIGEGGCIDLFDFDRCSGLLSNFRDIGEHLFDPEHQYFGGSLATNNNLLYVSPFNVIKNFYQYDLTAPNIQATKLLIKSYPDTGIMQYVQFNMHQLGPDGKIYVSKSNGYGINSNTPFTQSLDVIEYPDSVGLACNYVENGFYLGGHFSTGGFPNMPNYNLGRLIGSPCDTLSPVTEIAKNDRAIKVFPNPSASGEFNIQFSDNSDGIHDLVVENVLGESVYNSTRSVSNINLSNLPSGIYFLKIHSLRGRTFVIKLSK